MRAHTPRRGDTYQHRLAPGPNTWRNPDEGTHNSPDEGRPPRGMGTPGVQIDLAQTVNWGTYKEHKQAQRDRHRQARRTTTSRQPPPRAQTRDPTDAARSDGPPLGSHVLLGLLAPPCVPRRQPASACLAPACRLLPAAPRGSGLPVRPLRLLALLACCNGSSPCGGAKSATSCPEASCSAAPGLSPHGGTAEGGTDDECARPKA